MTKRQIFDAIDIFRDACEGVPDGAGIIMSRIMDYTCEKNIDDFIASYPPLPKNANIQDD